MSHLEELQTLHLNKVDKLLFQAKETHQEILESSQSFTTSLLSDYARQQEGIQQEIDALNTQYSLYTDTL